MKRKPLQRRKGKYGTDSGARFVAFTFPLEESLHQRLAIKAIRERTTMRALAAAAIARIFEREEKEPAA